MKEFSSNIRHILLICGMCSHGVLFERFVGNEENKIQITNCVFDLTPISFYVCIQSIVYVFFDDVQLQCNYSTLNTEL